MKKIFYLVLTLICVLTCTQCSSWTEPSKSYGEPINSNAEAYYKALREYKKSDHPIVFGWYSGWTGTGTNMYNQLRGIPDSMDVISLWGGAFNLDDAQRSDLKEVREKKGLRVLYCQHIMDIGREHTPKSVEQEFLVDGVQYASREEAMAAYWGWFGNHGDTTNEGIDAAIRKYARVIVDSVMKYDYDGFDIDYEPNYGYPGNISSYPDRMHILIDELSKYFGPKSNTGKLFVIDGEPQTLLTESGPLIDYYIIQAYYCTGDQNLDMRFTKLLNKFSSVEDEATILSKTVWCEDFEKHKGDGGPQFTSRDGIVTYSLDGMSLYYRPNVSARIGGVGAFRFNLCRPVDDYLFMRKAIQTLNPSKH